MPDTKWPLKLTKSYIHFDHLIWQVPAVGVAIAGGIVVAADQIEFSKGYLSISAQCVRALIVFFGALITGALGLIVCKFRIFQSATIPREWLNFPDGASLPFGIRPSGGFLLQLVLFVTSGGMAGLALANASQQPWCIIGGLFLGVIGGLIVEHCYFERARDAVNAVRYAEENAHPQGSRTTAAPDRS